MCSGAGRGSHVTQPLSVPGSARGRPPASPPSSEMDRRLGLFAAADRCEHQGGGAEKDDGGGFRNGYLRGQELGHQA